MRLSLYTDYALRTLIYLAGRPGRSNVATIASFYLISKDHVAKAVQQLARLGFIRSVRGVGGGIELAQAAEQISIGEVVLAMEGSTHLLDCVVHKDVCSIQPGCKLRTVFAQAEKIQMDFLKSVRLSDVVTPGGRLIEITKEINQEV